jgi:hypothetical protein
VAQKPPVSQEEMSPMRSHSMLIEGSLTHSNSQKERAR